MKNWFEEWESTFSENEKDYLDKVEETDSLVHHSSARKNHREVAWVRNHNFKRNQVKKFYDSVWGGDNIGEDGDCVIISHTLTNYYVTNANKPTHIRRIEGEHNYYTWAGPKWNRFKRKVTNRNIRRNRSLEPIARTKTVFKENGPRNFD